MYFKNKRGKRKIVSSPFSSQVPLEVSQGHLGGGPSGIYTENHITRLTSHMGLQRNILTRMGIFKGKRKLLPSFLEGFPHLFSGGMTKLGWKITPFFIFLICYFVVDDRRSRRRRRSRSCPSIIALFTTPSRATVIATAAPTAAIPSALPFLSGSLLTSSTLPGKFFANLFFSRRPEPKMGNQDACD